MKNAIFITGCNKRIGLHLTKRFLDDGYYVIAHYRKMTPELEMCKNRNVVLVSGDLASTKDIKAIVQRVSIFTKSLRAIIHNASFYEKTSDDLDKAQEQYQNFFSVHMLAPFILNEKLRPLLERGEGSRDIIHITDANLSRPNPDFDLYSSTKAALDNLSRSYAKKLAPRIKVNCVAPGPIMFSKKESESMKKAALAKTLLRKEGGAECVYKAVHSVLDNDFMTGSCLYVDGGRTLG